MAGHPSLTQVVGRAENAFGALMRRVLATAGGTFHQWVCLSVLASAGGALAGERLAERVTGALKIDRGLVAGAVKELAAEGYVRGDVERGDIEGGDIERGDIERGDIERGDIEGGEIVLTERGRGRFNDLRAAIEAATAPLYERLPEAEIATTARVLETMTARANAQLAEPRT
jgi:DNA-binding MarR family transcriptional regulator